MRIALGVDGGATKTMAAVGDETGQILGVGLAGPTNYQLIGLEAAMKNLSDSVQMALSSAKVSMEQVEFAVFGLAGADFPVDFENLTRGIKHLYPGLRFELVNDTWVGFRSGTDKDYGAVVIAGTGANFAAKAPDGRMITGRGMGYEWGSEGGAGSLIRQALHFAFRSHDGTGPKTALEETVLSVLGFSSYDDLAFYMYQVAGEFSKIYMKAARIVPALFELANGGDEVACEILSRSGKVMGEIVGGMIRRLGSSHLPQEVVMVGSLFTKGSNPLMVDHFKASCHRYVPLAEFKLPEIEPSGGAYLMALEKMNVDSRGAVRKRAIETFPRIDLPGELVI
ncbi:MAG TPA: hypothetical protein GXX30_05270 [Firmicutes bacterium]|nr:hypothetical protein [Candidatus Fermentithermobacillaceae bacterium]